MINFKRGNVRYRIHSGNIGDLANNQAAITGDIRWMKDAYDGPQRWFKRRDKWTIWDCHGEVHVDIWGEKKEEVKEEELPKFDFEGQYFVPAIGLTRQENLETDWWLDVTPDEGDVSVCASSDWSGRITTVLETPYPYAAGERFDHKLPPIEARSLVQWGTPFQLESTTDLIRDDQTDTLFSPVPWKGYSANGGFDYTKFHLQQAFGTDATGPACGQDNRCPGYLAPGGKSIYYSGSHCYGSGYCDDWDDSACPCCKRFVRQPHYYWSYFCGDWHLYFATAAREVRPVDTAEANCIIYQCFYTWGPSECIDESVAFNKSYGSPQSRTIIDTYITKQTLSNKDPLERSGDIIQSWENAGRDQTMTVVVSLDGNCQRTQQTTRDFWWMVMGGEAKYVKNSCPVQGLIDKYFIVGIESYWTEEGSGSQNHWSVHRQGGYDITTGEYRQGEFSYGTASITKRKWEILYANINGERVVIDEGAPYDYVGVNEHFSVLDTAIFYAGKPIYMYSYIKYLIHWENEMEMPPVIDYVRYGYFVENESNHVQSKKFTAAGFKDVWDYEFPYHDVYGSEEDGKYGNGKCGAFFVYPTGGFIL